MVKNRNWKTEFDKLGLKIDNKVSVKETDLPGRVLGSFTITDNLIEVDPDKLVASTIYHELVQEALRKLIRDLVVSLIDKFKWTAKEKRQLLQALQAVVAKEEELVLTIEVVFAQVWAKYKSEKEKCSKI